MKKRFLFGTVLLVLLSSVFGCSAPQARLKGNPDLKSVAVVSVAVSDWGGTVNANSVGKDSVGQMMQDATVKILNVTEATLAEHFQVKKAATFIKDKGYRGAAEDIRVSVYTPIIGGKPMPLFGKGIKRGDVTPAKAKELCAALNVDAVVFVFSEWTAVTGGFVPLTKALTKNIVSFWDKNGKKIFYRRKDAQGHKNLGAFGIKVVNAETIKEWTDGYEGALLTMFRNL